MLFAFRALRRRIWFGAAFSILILGALRGPSVASAQDATPAVEAAAPTAKTDSPPPPASNAKEHEASVSFNFGDDEEQRIPRDVRERLTPEQLYQIELTRAATTSGPKSYESIIVPIGFFLMILGIVGLSMWARFRRQRMLHDTVRLMVEKGQPLPPEIFQEAAAPRVKSDLRRGLVWMAVGIGLVAHFAADHDSTWGMGLIPLFIGVGYLIAWKIERPLPRDKSA